MGPAGKVCDNIYNVPIVCMYYTACTTLINQAEWPLRKFDFEALLQ